MNITDNELKLESLVAGELDHLQRSQWLAGLEDDSTKWKQIALAFIENQIITEAIGEGLPPNASKVTFPSIPAGTSTFQRKSFVSMGWLVATAVALLLGLSIGTLLPRNSDSAIGFQPPIENETRESIADADGSPQQMELADAIARCATPVPHGFRRSLLQAGYYLDENQEMKDVQLPNGQSIRMPIRKVNVRYLGSNAYQ